MASDSRDDLQRDVEIAAAYSGPLPPPDWLQAYDDVVPGLAEEIIAEARA